MYNGAYSFTLKTEEILALLEEKTDSYVWTGDQALNPQSGHNVAHLGG